MWPSWTAAACAGHLNAIWHISEPENTIQCGRLGRLLLVRCMKSHDIVSSDTSQSLKIQCGRPGRLVLVWKIKSCKASIFTNSTAIRPSRTIVACVRLSVTWSNHTHRLSNCVAVPDGCCMCRTLNVTWHCVIWHISEPENTMWPSWTAAACAVHEVTWLLSCDSSQSLKNTMWPSQTAVACAEH
jgi:hypothetical protein